MQCIICRKIKNKAKFSLEHIIPESLGNSKYVLDNICKECNSKLGAQVDSELVNFEIFSYPRNKLNLRGKKNRLPKMFKSAKLEDGRPAFVSYNKVTGKLRVNPPSIIKLKKEKDGFRYEVSSSSANDAIEVLNKKYERTTGKVLQKDQEEIIKKFSENISIKDATIKDTLTINILKINLAFIKIAYELIFYLELLDKDRSEYLRDYKLKEISNMISNYIYYGKRPRELPIVDKVTDKEVQDVFNHVSKGIFKHKFCHFISIYSSKINRTITYRISLLNSLSYYIIIKDIDCKDFNKNICIDPVTFKESHF